MSPSLLTAGPSVEGQYQPTDCALTRSLVSIWTTAMAPTSWSSATSSGIPAGRLSSLSKPQVGETVGLGRYHPIQAFIFVHELVHAMGALGDSCELF